MKFSLTLILLSLVAAHGADIPLRTIDGEESSLAAYKGEVLLIVNVASQCGETPQYAELQALHERFSDKGLKVLAFPSNDFGGQEPGSNAEIKEFCASRYQTKFDLFEKVSIKGEKPHPLYKFLTEPETNPSLFGPVGWNFEKFLISREGKIVNRWRSSVQPSDAAVRGAIEWELADAAGRAALETEGGSPGSLDEYMGRKTAKTMSYHGANWLIRNNRESEEKTTEMMPQLGLKAGMNVADIGSGNGYHTLLMAEMIGKEGAAYAVDVQPEMLALLKKRAADAGIENVKYILNSYWDAKLPENSIDLALMVDVYHEFSHPEQMLASIRKALRPGGRVALVEFRLEDDTVPIKLLHKMSKEQIMREFPANGFKLVESYDKLPWQHLMFFEATEEPRKDTNPQLPDPEVGHP
jgi:glutathione peroxidase-family protein/ubiquinone/menaquinone biosynthesis C-methylase UbiE